MEKFKDNFYKEKSFTHVYTGTDTVLIDVSVVGHGIDVIELDDQGIDSMIVYLQSIKIQKKRLKFYFI
jgi:hypothetical protein